MTTRLLWLAPLLTVLAATPARAADWNPRAYTEENTLELRTTGPEEGEYWFPVWLVVVDDQVYVRLGTRAAERVEKNTTSPYVGVRVAGHQFDKMRAVLAPEYKERVAQAIGIKYWSDVFIRYFDHPLTMRLVPATVAAK